jgi:Putative Se/S carrier protein-like
MKICIFRSTRDVIRAEKICRTGEIPCRIIPVPRSLSPQCGMALELAPEVYGAAESLLREAAISFQMFERNELTL